MSDTKPRMALSSGSISRKDGPQSPKSTRARVSPRNSGGFKTLTSPRDFLSNFSATSPRGHKSSPRISRRKRSISSPRGLTEANNAPPLRYEIFDKLALHIENYGLQQEGIFRIAGDSIVTGDLFQALDGDPTKIPLRDLKINVVADALKLYLRKQPESLLPTEVYDHFNSVLKLVSGFGGSNSKEEEDTDDKTDILIQLCQKLPAEHKPILRRLLQLLWEVHTRSDVNKMTADNLSMVFGPCIVQNMETVTDMSTIYAKSQEGVEMCKLLILNCNKLLSVLPMGKQYCLLGKPSKLKWKLVDSLSASGTPRVFAKGSKIIKKGSNSGYVYLLYSGTVRVSTPNMKSYMVSKADLLGDVALLGVSCAALEITCTTSVRAYEIDQRVFDCLFVNEPFFVYHLFWKHAKNFAGYVLKSKRTENEMISSVPFEISFERDVRVNVASILEHKIEDSITLYCNEQERISDVLTASIQRFGFKESKDFLYRITDKLPSAKLTKVRRPSMNALYSFLDEDEKLQTMLSADSSSREIFLYIVECSESEFLSAKRTQNRSRSVDTKLEFKELKGIIQFNCKIKNNRVTLKIFPRSLLYISNGAYGKEKKISLPFGQLQIKSDSSDPLTIYFSSTKKTKRRPFVFSSEDALVSALQYINALQNVLCPDEAVGMLEVPASRGIVKDWETVGVDDFQIRRSDVLLLSEPIDGEYSAEYGGCVGQISTASVELIDEIPILRALVDQKVFTTRTLCYMPTKLQWDTFMSTGVETTFAAGDKIITQGDRKQYLYFIHSGKCRVTTDTQNFASKTLDSFLLRGLEPNDFFGLECFLLGGESSYCVECIDDNAVVRIFDPECVGELFRRETGLAGSVMKYFCCVLYDLLNTADDDYAVRFRTTSI